MVAYRYLYQLILGPALIIVLAVNLVLLVRFPSLRIWIGAALVVIGIGENLIAVPLMSTLLGFLIAITTLLTGIAVCSSTVCLRLKDVFSKPTISAASILFGIFLVFVAVPSMSFWVFILGLFFLIAGVVTGSIYASLRLHSSSLKAKLAVLLIALGIVEVFVIAMRSFEWSLVFGSATLLWGIVMGGSVLLPWARRHLSQQKTRILRIGIYTSLVIVICGSASVMALRATNVLREELYDDWTWTTTADTTVRGVVTGIYLNYEVNNYGYSYHIFPALIIVNVTEVVKVGESLMNLTEESEHWVNENMTVAYDRPDVPSVTVGQRVEASGYYDVPVEDSWSYSFKLVVAEEIDGSYVTSLQG
jgi:hypothetical protein